MLVLYSNTFPRLYTVWFLCNMISCGYFWIVLLTLSSVCGFIYIYDVSRAGHILVRCPNLHDCLLRVPETLTRNLISTSLFSLCFLAVLLVAVCPNSPSSLRSCVPSSGFPNFKHAYLPTKPKTEPHLPEHTYQTYSIPRSLRLARA